MARSRRRKKTNLFPIISVVLMALFACLLVFIVFFNKGKPEAGSSQSESTSSGISESGEVPSRTTSSSQSGNSASSSPAASSGGSSTVDKTAWNLLLVNDNNPMPEGYTLKVSQIDSKYIASGFGKAYFDSRAIEQLHAMLNAAHADGVDLRVRTGYRSVSHQASLFNDKVKSFTDKGYSKEEAAIEAAKSIARPGHSEHNLGLSVDFNSLSESFEKTKEFKWLQQHAAEYGFILRYPKEKQHITGIIYEPWHYRFVGAEHAKVIMEKGLCLEEYLENQ